MEPMHSPKTIVVFCAGSNNHQNATNWAVGSRLEIIHRMFGSSVPVEVDLLRVECIEILD
jgi:hypothetical protein